MDLLKGKQIMVWTFMGNSRMYQALRDYGDRISQVDIYYNGVGIIREPSPEEMEEYFQAHLNRTKAKTA